MAKLMLDTEDVDGTLQVQVGAEYRQRVGPFRVMIGIRAVVSQQTVGDLPRYSTPSFADEIKDNEAARYIETSIEKGDEATVVLVRTPPEARTRERFEPKEYEPPLETSDTISIERTYTGLIYATLHVDSAEFDAIERRIAAHGMPYRIFIEWTIPPASAAKSRHASGKRELQGERIWRTYDHLELEIQNWRLLWAVSPPRFSPKWIDNRTATRGDARQGIKMLASLMRWTKALLWIGVALLIVALLRN